MFGGDPNTLLGQTAKSRAECLSAPGFRAAAARRAIGVATNIRKHATTRRSTGRSADNCAAVAAECQRAHIGAQFIGEGKARR